jgi:hypothetical protein
MATIAFVKTPHALVPAILFKSFNKCIGKLGNLDLNHLIVSGETVFPFPLSTLVLNLLVFFFFVGAISTSLVCCVGLETTPVSLLKLNSSCSLCFK